ncbi:MAG: hypothetical protein NW207_09055 [Cytophagales bacterium]|nr:hypothetical protein [Cytophagales bacterium]
MKIIKTLIFLCFFLGAYTSGYACSCQNEFANFFESYNAKGYTAVVKLISINTTLSSNISSVNLEVIDSINSNNVLVKVNAISLNETLTSCSIDYAQYKIGDTLAMHLTVSAGGGYYVAPCNQNLIQIKNSVYNGYTIEQIKHKLLNPDPIVPFVSFAGTLMGSWKLYEIWDGTASTLYDSTWQGKTMKLTILTLSGVNNVLKFKFYANNTLVKDTVLGFSESQRFSNGGKYWKTNTLNPMGGSIPKEVSCQITLLSNKLTLNNTNPNRLPYKTTYGYTRLSDTIITSLVKKPILATQIFPNPVSSTIYIESMCEAHGIIYNSTGIEVMKLIINKGRNEIEVSTLPSSQYFLLQKEGSNINVIKFNKQ